MKQLKLNKLEKFIIKHETFLSALFIVLWIIYSIAFGKVKSLRFIGLGITAFLAFFVGCYSEILRKKAGRLYKNALDPSGAYQLLNEFIDLININRNPNKFYLYFDLMSYCLSLGDYTGVIDLCTRVRRECKSKKLEDSFDLSVRLFLSASYLYRGEKSLYDKEFDYIDEIAHKKGVSKFVTCHQYTEVKLIEESLYGAESADFETSVLDFLYGKKENGKIKNKKPSKMQFISAYGILFNYYKRLGNTKKATEYAEMILNDGNEQLVVYRNAKEYSENADKSN